MRSGTSALTGNLRAAVSHFSSSTSTAPASDRLCDTTVIGFALWTVCAHAVVASGRGLVALLVLYAVVLAAGLWLRLRFAAVLRESDPSRLVVPSASPGPTILIPRIVGLVAGVAVALSYAVQPDAYRLWWSALILLGFAAVFVCFRDPTQISPVARSRSSEVLLWGLAAAGVVLMLISHRPDADDAFYVNVAVATADVPGRALLSEDTMHGIPGLPLYLPVYRVHSYELLNGALAYLSGIPAIYSFHWLSASFAALLVPLAHAKLFRLLSPRRWLATVVTLVFVLVAVGETHRWYGNFSFVRMWQGKAIFLFVVTPLVYAYALRFALRPNLRDWAMLAMAQIAAVGCTSSALWAAPVGAVLALCSAVRPSRAGLKTVVLGALASVYVLAAAWLVRRSLDGPSTGSLSQGGLQATPQLHGALVTNALVTVLGDSRLLTFGILALLTGWVFAPPGLSRRFALVFPLGVLLGLLNPSIADWVAANVTGSTYWRSMWALPLPIVMALMLMWPLHLGDGLSHKGMRYAAWVVLLAAFALLVPGYNGLSGENGVRLTWPGLKVPAAAYRWAGAVNASVPPGSHVAVPLDIGTWIVTFHNHVYPLVVRDYVRTSHESWSHRLAMQRFLENPELVDANPGQFQDGLERFELRAVCLVNTPRAGVARAILRQAGFRLTLRRDDYDLWVRPGPGLHPHGGGNDR